ncbi:MAG: hypothetical protein U9O87_11105 [Verrucomicrobiota bacterium]|nr:hypothetical protein [Verrucomicrobiota bacterium]
MNATGINATGTVYTGIANKCNSNGAAGWITSAFATNIVPYSDDYTDHNADTSSGAPHNGYIRWRHKNDRVASTLFADLHAGGLNIKNTIYNNCVWRYTDE